MPPSRSRLTLSLLAAAVLSWPVPAAQAGRAPLFAREALGDTGSAIPAGPAATPSPAGDKAGGAWSDAFYYATDLNAQATAVFARADGIVASGYFDRAGNTPLNHVALWNGATWTPMGAGLPNWVYAFAEFQGQLYAGAYRWDGSAWENVLQTDSRIAAMVVRDDRLLVAGYFTHARGDSVPYLFAWDGTAITPIEGSPNGPVRALALRDSLLAVGGQFGQVGAGTAVKNLALWDGHAWSDLGGGIDGVQTFCCNEYGMETTYWPFVQALAWWGEDLVVGGRFTTAGQTPAHALARWDGQAWQEPAPDLATFVCDSGGLGEAPVCWPPAVTCLLVQDGTLYVGGEFEIVAGIESKGIARWDGSTWRGFGSGVLSGYANALAPFAGDLYVAGTFLPQAPAMPQSGGVSKWTGSGWARLDGPPGLGVSWSVQALLPYGDDLIVAGYFETGGKQHSIAATDGHAYSPLGASGADGEVDALALFGSDLVAAGRFTQIGGIPARNLATWNGTAWQPLGEGPDFEVTALAVHDGRLYAGGTTGSVAWPVPREWKAATGTSGERLADVGRLSRWNGATWEPLLTTDRNVRAIASYGGELWVGGEFRTANGQPTSRLFRLAAESGSIVPVAMTGGEVRCLTVWDGRLIVGGYFSAVEGLSTADLAAWDGAEWSVPGRMTGGSSLMGVYGLYGIGEQLFVLGNFTGADGVAATDVAMWNGTAWRGFGSGVAVFPFCAATYHGQLYVGGHFNFAGGLLSRSLARWEEEGLPVAFTSFSAERSGRAARVRWRLQGNGGLTRVHVWRAGSGAGASRIRLTAAPLEAATGGFIDPAPPAGEADYWLEALDPNDGAASWQGPAHLAAAPVPARLRLDQNRPNPFNPRTVLTLALPEPGPVTLAVFDARGRRVATLVAGTLPAGEREAAWDGRDARGRLLPSGEYLARLITPAGTRAIKLTLAR